MSLNIEEEIYSNDDFSADDDIADPNYLQETPSKKRKLMVYTSETPKKVRTSSLPIILGPNFYTDLQEIPNETKVYLSAKCVTCGRVIKGSTEVTSNFVKHIRLRHRVIYDEYHNLKMNRTGSCSLQEDYDINLIDAIVDAGLPPSLLDRPKFIKALKSYKPGLKVMTRKTFMKKLEDQYVKANEKIKEEIGNSEYFCTSADIWSGSHRSFFGYTCHWLTDKMERKSAALACKRLSGVHSSEKLAQIITEINSSFGLNKSNVVMTVTDNGSNFVKAFKEHGVQPEMNDDSDDDLPTFSNECLLPQHQRCASHTLNLLATTDLVTVLKSNQDIYLQHTEVLAKCNNLWKKSKWPKSSEVILSSLGSALLVSVVTRWNSLYDAVLRLLRHKAKLNDLCAQFDLTEFTSGDFAYLEQYSLLMEPIANVIDEIQGEVDVKYGCLLPSLLTLRNKLMKLSMSNDLPILNHVAMMLDQSLRKRFEPYFTLAPSVDIAIVAAVLTPDVKTDWIEALHDTLPDLIAEDINSRVINTIWKSLLKDSNVLEAISTTASCPPKRKSKYDFKRTGDGEETNATATASHSGDVKAAIASQYYSYLNDQSMTDSTWTRYPLLQEAFLKFNTPLPSSAPVERLFSFAGIINSPRRNSLTDYSFEKLVLMKANSKWL